MIFTTASLQSSIVTKRRYNYIRFNSQQGPHLSSLSGVHCVTVRWHCAHCSSALVFIYSTYIGHRNLLYKCVFHLSSCCPPTCSIGVGFDTTLRSRRTSACSSCSNAPLPPPQHWGCTMVLYFSVVSGSWRRTDVRE